MMTMSNANVQVTKSNTHMQALCVCNGNYILKSLNMVLVLRLEQRCIIQCRISWDLSGLSSTIRRSKMLIQSYVKYTGRGPFLAKKCYRVPAECLDMVITCEQISLVLLSLNFESYHQDTRSLWPWEGGRSYSHHRGLAKIHLECTCT